MSDKIFYLKKGMAVCTKRRTRNKTFFLISAILALGDLRVRRISNLLIFYF